MSKQASKLALVPYKKISSPEAIVVTYAEPRKTRRRNRRRRVKGVLTQSKTTSSFVSAYAKCMNNPFTCVPGPLGLGTLVPTSIATAGVRGSFTTNADGSFTLVCNPYRVRVTNSAAYGSFLAVDTAGYATTPTWAIRYDASDLTSLAATYDRLRVICGGVRVYSTAAETATKGAMYAALVCPSGTDETAITNQSVPGSQAFVPNNGTANPSAALMVGYPGMRFSLETRVSQAIWRPSQFSDFDFNSMRAANGDPRSQGPVPVIIGSGLPASTTIWFDAIFHYEGYNSTGIAPNAPMGASPMTGTMAPTINKSKPATIDSLWSSVQPYLSSAIDFFSEVGPMALDLFNGAGFAKSFSGLGITPSSASLRPSTSPSTEEKDTDDKKVVHVSQLRQPQQRYFSP